MKQNIGLFALLLFSSSVLAEPMHEQQGQKNMMETTNETAAPATQQSDEKPMASGEMMQEQSGFSRGSVVRSAFTTEIADREPLENLQNLTNENGKVMFFTELRDMSGQTALHRWEYEGKVMAEVPFKVRGPRWRVWSSKAMMPQWTGEWKVSVINGAGEVIAEKNLKVVASSDNNGEAAMQQKEEKTGMMQQNHMQ